MKRGAVIAWSVWTSSIIMAIAAFAFLWLGRETSPPPGTFGFRGFSAIFAVIFSSVGLLVALKRPENPIGWLFLVTGMASGFQEFSQQYAIYSLLDSPNTLPGGRYFAWIGSWIWIPITGGLALFLFQLFPSGRFTSKHYKPVVAIGSMGIIVAALSAGLTSGPLENFLIVNNPFAIPNSRWLFNVTNIALGVYGLAVLGSVVSLGIRFRRSRGEERQQMKWLLASGVLMISTLMVSFSVPATQGGTDVDWNGIDVLVILSFLTIPIATAIAILKYRLFEIDVILNKALVYAIVAGFITALYGAIVVAPTALFFDISRSHLVPTFIAVTVIAAAFEPARRRAQKFANRLIYGERATPYEAMARFSERMSSALSVDEVLPRMAEAAARGVNASRASVKVSLPHGDERSAVWPQAAEQGGWDESLPILHRGETVGEISIAKPPNDPLTPAESKLLSDLASQAGPALHNVRLTQELQARLDEISAQAAELRASRQRIVNAQDSERRRIERDIHDGAQQQLVSLAVKISLVRNLVNSKPDKALELLDQLKLETQDAVDSLRELARGLFPRILVDKGLVSAVEAHIAKANIDASVVDRTEGDRLPTEVEANVFFVIREALQNASKHAPDSPVVIEIGAGSGRLTFCVADHGEGFDVNGIEAGMGLHNMQDRIVALGGDFRIESSPGMGTRIVGSVPADASTSDASG